MERWYELNQFFDETGWEFNIEIVAFITIFSSQKKNKISSFCVFCWKKFYAFCWSCNVLVDNERPVLTNVLMGHGGIELFLSIEMFRLFSW